MRRSRICLANASAARTSVTELTWKHSAPARSNASRSSSANHRYRARCEGPEGDVMPDLEAEQRPDADVLVSSSSVVSQEELLDLAAIEHLADERLVGQQRVPCECSKPPTEPPVEWNAESGLPSLHNLHRELRRGDLTDDPLATAAPDLDPIRQRQAELDQPVVEKRGPQLDGGRHRHSITTLEQVVGEPRPAVGHQHALQRSAWLGDVGVTVTGSMTEQCAP